MVRKAVTVTRKAPEDWLHAGLAIIREHGIDALSLERLCAQVGLTKGSFYHHFQNLAAYRTALLEHFERVAFTRMVDDANRAPQAHLRLQRLIADIASRTPDLEIAMRTWATRDPEPRARMQRIDAERLEYLAGLLTEISGDAQRGRLLARLHYAVFLGAMQLRPASFGDEFRRMLGELEPLLNPAARGGAA
ncbi:AcrR family transcriptional regulator [Deinobacterium chartae]|uniref:AcrR family transcriptional regulator n=1 Tax=Deinobacterium chartae TaxID=521158 RepID=A0A841HWP5_9DEIO|nr:TetR/AcrR family transcriptional regulator [Deinobacterium chartae]MBB6096669.1 AcrR family transcriptional regulator [Deinobacterium chartae]